MDKAYEELVSKEKAGREFNLCSTDVMHFCTTKK